MSLLLEVVVGLGVFVVAALIMIGTFPTFHRALTAAKNYSTASYVARDFMERERALAGQPTVTPRTFPYPVTYSIDGKIITTVFQVDIAYQTYDASLPQARRGVQVRVTWSEGPIRREVFYETFHPL